MNGLVGSGVGRRLVDVELTIEIGGKYGVYGSAMDRSIMTRVIGRFGMYVEERN